jgi:hypothetical protein
MCLPSEGVSLPCLSLPALAKDDLAIKISGMSLHAETQAADDRFVPANVMVTAQQAVKDCHECFW